MEIEIWLRPMKPKPNTRARDGQDRHRRQQNFGARFPRTFAALERSKIAMHSRGRLVTLLRIVRARLDQHIVELKQLFAVRSLTQLRIDLWKIEPVFSGAGLVEKFAQAVDIGLGRARTLRWDIAFGADER